MIISRKRRDFTERDRTILNLFRPHMVAAYELADRFSRMKHDAETATHAVESMNVGLIRVNRGGEITFMSAKARLWLERHLPEPAEESRLPDVLDRWLDQLRHDSANGARRRSALNLPTVFWRSVGSNWKATICCCWNVTRASVRPSRWKRGTDSAQSAGAVVGERRKNQSGDRDHPGRKSANGAETPGAHLRKARCGDAHRSRDESERGVAEFCRLMRPDC